MISLISNFNYLLTLRLKIASKYTWKQWHKSRLQDTALLQVTQSPLSSSLALAQVLIGWNLWRQSSMFTRVIQVMELKKLFISKIIQQHDSSAKVLIKNSVFKKLKCNLIQPPEVSFAGVAFSNTQFSNIWKFLNSFFKCINIKIFFSYMSISRKIFGRSYVIHK